MKFSTIRTNMLPNSSSLLLLLAMSVVPVSTGAAKESDDAVCFGSFHGVCEVSILSVLSDPNSVVDRRIKLVGFLGELNGSTRLYANEDARLTGDIASSLLVINADSYRGKGMVGMQDSYVRVIGVLTFDGDEQFDRRFSLSVERASVLMRPAQRDRFRELFRASDQPRESPEG